MATRAPTTKRSDYGRELRMALARELHDGPIRELNQCVVRLETSRLGSAKPEMQVAITAVEEHARAALTSLRRITRELRDEQPHERVASAVLDLVSRYGNIAGEVRAVISPAWPAALPAPIALHLARIVQEAVSNAVSHARAAHILIELNAESNRLVAVVSDDGCGIAAGVPEGTGISGMRERAAILGGRLTVRPRDPGTIVRVEVPI